MKPRFSKSSYFSGKSATPGKTLASTNLFHNFTTERIHSILVDGLSEEHWDSDDTKLVLNAVSELKKGMHDGLAFDITNRALFVVTLAITSMDLLN